MLVGACGPKAINKILLSCYTDKGGKYHAYDEFQNILMDRLYDVLVLNSQQALI